MELSQDPVSETPTIVAWKNRDMPISQRIEALTEAHKQGEREFIGADLRSADLSGADLSGADLRGANLRSANLRDADLYGADLRSADLSDANLSDADLSGANLRGADLYGADLRSADLSGADLSGADLYGADLSQATGVFNAIDWLQENFEFVDNKLIAYKSFGSQYGAPDTWTIEPDAVIEEVVNPLPTVDCACGINVATLDWVRKNANGTIWRVEIEPLWLVSAVVPYNTDGKFRVGQARLVEIVEPQS